MSIKMSFWVTATSLAFTASCTISTKAEAAFALVPAICSTEQIMQNDATVRIVFEEILSRGSFDENEAIYHRNFVAHGLTRDAGREEDRAAGEAWRKMAPDLQMHVKLVVADCHTAAVHWEGTGTNTGGGMGLPANGAVMRAQGATFFKFLDGQIAEEWTVFDESTMMKQLRAPSQ